MSSNDLVEVLPPYIEMMWGKTRDRYGKNKSIDDHQPLICHMIDTSMVASAIWEDVMPISSKEKLTFHFGLDEDDMKKWISFLAGIHDLGKATPDFQSKSLVMKEWLVTVGLEFPQTARTIRHGAATTLALESVLVSCGAKKRDAYMLSQVVGGHHGIFPRSGEISDIGMASFGEGVWEDIRSTLVDFLLNCTGAHDIRIDRMKWNGLSSTGGVVVLAGLISISDWIASDREYFPFSSHLTDLAGYVESSKKMAQDVLRKIAWSPQPSPPDDCPSWDDLFKDLGPPRPLQETTIHQSKSIIPPCLVVIEAPTGEGKTEAALYLTAKWEIGQDHPGFYFALPTQATSNQMFSRVREYLESGYPQDSGEVVSLMLLHGNSEMNKELQDLHDRWDELIHPSSGDDYDYGVPGGIVAGEWFTSRKRGLLSPFGVGTIDQTLLSILQTKHFFVRLFGLSGKTIVFDEIHAYDVYMSTLLDRLLEWLAILSCPVVLMSATLPSVQRERLTLAYSRGLQSPMKETRTIVSYPRMSWVDGRGHGCVPLETSGTGSRTIELSWQEPGDGCKEHSLTDILDIVREVVKGGGCIAIILNTVTRAQEVFNTIQRSREEGDVTLNLDEMFLLHSRFPLEDRQRLEKKATSMFGREGEDRPKRAVLVSTQIIEQSMDLDFDCMITDFAPVDLLIQRAGRLHRHDRIRPESHDVPRLIILSPSVDPDGVPTFSSGSKNVYEPYILLRSYLALGNRDRINVPDDIETIVEEVYREGFSSQDCNEVLKKLLESTWDVLRRNTLLSEGKAHNTMIPPPTVSPSTLTENLILELEEDDPNIHKSLRAFTRISGPSVSLVPLYESSKIPTFDPDGIRPVDLKATPDKEMKKALVMRTIQVSHRGVVRYFSKENMAPKGWRRTGVLRHHRVLLLREDGTAEIDGFAINLDVNLGLLIKTCNGGE